MIQPKEEFVFQPYKVTEVEFRSQEKPRPRSGHRIACDDNNIYCFGGYSPSLPASDIERVNPTWTPVKPLFKELWTFSIATRKWKLHREIENMPDELASTAMCMNGSCVMIFGGTGIPFGHKRSNDVLVWRPYSDPTKLQVLDVSGPRPPGQYGQAVLCHDGYFYTIGGTNGFVYNCDIFRLDLRTMDWDPVFVGTGQEGEPAGRYRHEVARVDNKLYIIGGGTGEWAFELMEIPMFDLKTKQWTTLIPKADPTCKDINTPLARKCHSAVQIDTPSGVQVFVTGGANGLSVYGDIWRLNMADLQWKLMEKSILPNPLYFHSTTVTSTGCMYIFGGIEPTDISSKRNNVLYKVWLCIPKLSEISWEAVLSYYENLDQLDRRTLLKMGIPIHFVDRIHPE